MRAEISDVNARSAQIDDPARIVTLIEVGMREDRKESLRRPTRRDVVMNFGRLGGFGLAVEAMNALSLVASAQGRPTLDLPGDLGRGRSVVVIGAGLAGLCSGLLLARAGFEVTILEAATRCGGRSLTLRDGYEFAERDGPTQRAELLGQDAYFNAGPGRIPRHHHTVLEWCRRLGVALEPYIFLCESNLYQSDGFNGGAPAPLGQMRYSLYGELAELLDKASRRRALDQELTGVDREALRHLLQAYGDLRREGEALVFAGSRRLGYRATPGGGDETGVELPPIPLERILGSDAVDRGLFTSMAVSWQNALLQPVGGMDMIWRALLRQEVPGGRQLRDLVRLGTPVQLLTQDESGCALDCGAAGRIRADFCVATLAPPLFAALAENLPAKLKEDCLALRFVAATKVGLETRRRFWETEDGIYGGISFVDADVSQIWYPSSGFGGASGVLTAAYARGAAAGRLAALPLAERLEAARAGGEKLHPGRFRANIRAGSEVSVAWSRMPFAAGGWSREDETAETGLRGMMEHIPWKRVFVAGDAFSHLPGWQEGALCSAELAARQIAARVAEMGRVGTLKRLPIERNRSIDENSLTNRE
ncbi:MULTISPECIES: flavin monoamine oxidase family protein [Methylosinus]|uniref:Tryptophan 2-monooxygenase n=1 Tax=Methylosinus trichosporium (strain ATCC 35070 / NCIMB 11131 / UNIQEM 75 / OB3b) TaxID=595536 RepID=A0A2D2D4H5_METT3|nr:MULTISPECIES: FAD-dependent oxidoreductase [Methylosinus]ATQ69908.1 hypothetical protein CQW49_19980 [Methylosinus trichosporium OB3b]OBS53877.1 hypothetical protein A8B73_03675 [Methylosinus sp. 3S-1]